jgi:hypothetical protein
MTKKNKIKDNSPEKIECSLKKIPAFIDNKQVEFNLYLNENGKVVLIGIKGGFHIRQFIYGVEMGFNLNGIEFIAQDDIEVMYRPSLNKFSKIYYFISYKWPIIEENFAGKFVNLKEIAYFKKDYKVTS